MRLVEKTGSVSHLTTQSLVLTTTGPINAVLSVFFVNVIMEISGT